MVSAWKDVMSSLYLCLPLLGPLSSVLGHLALAGRSGGASLLRLVRVPGAVVASLPPSLLQSRNPSGPF